MSKKKDPIQFQIRSIELLESSLILPGKPLSESSVFEFDINLEHHITNPEDTSFIVICNVRIMGETESELYGKIRTSCVYEIPNLSEYYFKEDNRFTLPDQLIFSLNSIAISTTRGMMFSFYRGTFLHNAILPIVDPKYFTSGNN